MTNEEMNKAIAEYCNHKDVAVRLVAEGTGWIPKYYAVCFKSESSE